jgi:glutathione S-transferase
VCLGEAILDANKIHGSEMINLHYFKGRGRAETSRWMLAINEIAFQNCPLATADDFTALKVTGKLLFNQLPLLEIDGKNLTQSTAIIRYLARKGNLYGDSADDVLMCDMVAGATADFAEAALQYAFQPTKDDGVELATKSFQKFATWFEELLSGNGGIYMVGSRLSFVDILLTEALSNYHEISPELFDTTPLLNRLRLLVISQPGISAYLASSNRWSMPDDQYVIDVAQVLCRALPAHMSDADRFVV